MRLEQAIFNHLNAHGYTATLARRGHDVAVSLPNNNRVNIELDENTGNISILTATEYQIDPADPDCFDQIIATVESFRNENLDG